MGEKRDTICERRLDWNNMHTNLLSLSYHSYHATQCSAILGVVIMPFHPSGCPSVRHTRVL